MSHGLEEKIKRIHPANYMHLAMRARDGKRALTGVAQDVLRWFSAMAFSTAWKAWLEQTSPPVPLGHAWFCEAACARETHHNIKSVRLAFRRLVSDHWLALDPDAPPHIIPGSGKKKPYYGLDLGVVGLRPSAHATGQNARHESDPAGRVARLRPAERPVLPGDSPGDLKSGSEVMIEASSMSSRSPGETPGSTLGPAASAFVKEKLANIASKAYRGGAGGM